MLLWLGVFAAVFLLDMLYALYTRATAGGQAFKAAAYATGIFAATGFATTGYVRDIWLLIPACVGAWAGTVVGMFLSKLERKNPHEDKDGVSSHSR